MSRRRSRTEYVRGHGSAHAPLRSASRLQSESRSLLDDRFDTTYKELLRVAKAVKRADVHATVGTSTVVHEAWMKLAGSPGLAIESELHFKRLAARAMRQIVMDHARRRRAHKRGGQGAAVFVTLDTSADLAVPRHEDLLRLDEALDALARTDPDKAELVQLRFFGGCEVSDVSIILGISESKALRDWRVAKAWLAAEVRKSR